MFKEKSLIKYNGKIYRVLDINNHNLLVIHCTQKPASPILLSVKESETETISEADMWASVGIQPRSNLTKEDQKKCQHRYNLIANIIPCITEETKKRRAISATAKESGLSKRTIKTYLNLYLVFQTKNILATKETKKKDLSPTEKQFRWALNKFYYTRFGKTITDTYMMLLKEKYSDGEGKLFQNHPSIHQFRRFFYKHRNHQTEIISRNGLKDYQMNHRPLIGGGIQDFANCIGTAMLDSTICDIYLADSSGNVVGRPILTICVDAYSRLICGYALTWEGGMYSLRDLMLNVASDKVSHCHKFGITIRKKDWDCQELPGKLVTDRGTEYASSNFEQLTELGCDITNLPPFRAELKGIVEQTFHQLQNSFRPFLKGRGIIETDYQKRGGHDYRKDACLTLNDFERILLHAIIYHNSQLTIQNFPYSKDMLNRSIPPHASDIWNHNRKYGSPNLISIEKDLLVKTLLPRTIGTFTRHGLIVNKLRYHSDGYTEEYLKGDQAIIAYNPEDTSSVYLVRDNFKKFQIIDCRFSDMSLIEAKTIKAKQRTFINSFAEENLQARLDLANHILAIAENITPKGHANLDKIRQTRYKATTDSHKDFLKQVSNG